MTRMVKSSVLVIVILIVAVLVVGCASPAAPNNESHRNQGVTFTEIRVMVFQSPDCECCGRYQGYLREHGFQADRTYVQDIHAIKQQYQIPPNMTSCHTAVIEGYFVEGHVPIEAITVLLAETPDIDGITLPGMPAGSPGMPGQQTAPFEIYALSDGKASEFMSING